MTEPQAPVGERDGLAERDKDRPIQVQCIAVIIQHATACDDDEALKAAYNIWDYTGRPLCVGNAPPVGERDGWQLVPKRPTQEMVIAGDEVFDDYIFREAKIDKVYRAMLAAVPSPPPETTVDTTKLNDGQLVQRIMRAMDGDVSSFTTASLAEYIAAEILKLPKDYWRKPPPETRAEDWRSGSLATYRGGIASAALTNGATYVVNAIILAHGAKYLQIITDDKTVRDLLSTHFTNTTSTEPPAAGAGERKTAKEIIAHIIYCDSDLWDLDDEGEQAANDIISELERSGYIIAPPDAARPSEET